MLQGCARLEQRVLRAAQQLRVLAKGAVHEVLLHHVAENALEPVRSHAAGADAFPTSPLLLSSLSKSATSSSTSHTARAIPSSDAALNAQSLASFFSISRSCQTGFVAVSRSMADGDAGKQPIMHIMVLVERAVTAAKQVTALVHSDGQVDDAPAQRMDFTVAACGRGVRTCAGQHRGELLTGESEGGGGGELLGRRVGGRTGGPVAQTRQSERGAFGTD